MHEWIRILKKSIEQIRNNNRTKPPSNIATGTAAACATSAALNPLGGAAGVLGSNPPATKHQKNAAGQGRKESQPHQKQQQHQQQKQQLLKTKELDEEVTKVVAGRSKSVDANKENLEEWTAEDRKQNKLVSIGLQWNH